MGFGSFSNNNELPARALLAVRVVETGCRCWVPGAGAGAGAVSWLCTWWRQGAGAGAGVLAVRVVETGCRVPVPGAGAGCWLERVFCSPYSDSYGVLIISKDNEPFAPVLVSADCARCGGAVSWLRKLRAFLFQPVARQ